MLTEIIAWSVFVWPIGVILGLLAGGVLGFELEDSVLPAMFWEVIVLGLIIIAPLIAVHSVGRYAGKFLFPRRDACN